jgi:signal peptidase II
VRVIYISLIVVIADQITKLMVKGFSIPFLNFTHEGMYHGQRIPIIGDFFRLTFIENPGMAFGLDPGLEWKMWVSLFSLVASIGLIIYMYAVRYQTLSLRVALAFILGGAIGNLIDRMFYGLFFNYAPLFYGKVVDFLDFDFFDFTLFGKNFDRWPVFNIADAAVTTGVLILIIFYKKHNEESKSDVEEAPAETASDASVVEPQINSGSGEEITENKNDGNNDEPDKGKEIPL